MLVIAYAGCHRPLRRVLSWARFTKLVDELHAYIDAGAIRRKGRSWTVTRAQWTEALRIVVERRNAGQLETPLKNHGYLLEVARGLSDRAEAAAETAVETARREGRGPERVSPADRYDALLAEGTRLGVVHDSPGLVRSPADLARAVEQAKAQEESI